MPLSGNNIFAGTYGGGVFRSSDNVSNWTEINTGLPNSPLEDLYISSLAVNSTTIFAGGLTIVWKRPLSEVVTGIWQVEKTNNVLVYPNYTHNSFTLDVDGSKTVKLYDMLGKEVLSQKTNGKTEVNINNLPNGVYNVHIVSDKGVIVSSKVVKQ